jgi:tetratricopeptide (TPR) repeat protein
METRDKAFSGSLAATPLPQVLRRIFLGGLKGTLRLARRDETRNVFFEKGELRNATSSREGQKIGAFLKRRGWITDKDLAWALETVSRQGRARLGKILVDRGLVSRAVLDAEMKRLVEEIVFSTFEWEEGEFRFEPAAGILDPDVALSLSTAAAIVEGIRRLPESDIFRERLGDGKRVPALAGDPLSRYQYLPLTPQEAYLLSRVDGLLDIEALLKLGGASRNAAAKTLYALLSCGILEWRSEKSVPIPEAVPDRLNVEVSPQADAPSPAYVEMVRNTYRRVDWLTHYELLGIGPEATPEEVRAAYFEKSRAFHPDLRHRPDLADCQRELETVFTRLRLAFETLSDARQRAEYDARVKAPADLALEPMAEPGARAEIAARSYARARELIAEKDFHPAVEMLREAIRSVPDNAEYRYCLAQVELQNANWVDKGLANLMEAARLEPKRQQYLREAARALLEHGRIAEAELFARRAVKLDPTAQNQQLLELVTSAAEKKSTPAPPPAAAEAPPAASRPVATAPAKSGLFRRLFRARR